VGTLKDGVMLRGTTWSYVIRVTDPASGRSKPRWVGGFRTEAEAKAARDEARVRARRGEYVDRSRITVGEYLDQWLDGHAMEVKPKTLASYRWIIDCYVKPRIGAQRLQSVSAAMATRLYHDLLKTGGRNGAGLSVRTVNYVHSVLRKAFTDAVHVDHLLPVNPVERAKRPRKGTTAPSAIWTPAQLRLFLEIARGHRLFAFFHLAAYTGARRGELLHLRWADVDLDAGAVALRGSAAVVDGARIEGTTKGGRERAVSIDAGTVKVLKEHKAAQAADRLIAGGSWAGREYVFTTGLGEPIYPDSPSQLMAKLIRNYNEPDGDVPKPAVPLPHVRLHDLRHIHATTLLLAGVPVHVVAHRLGHADPSITLRVYAHVMNTQTAAVAEEFVRAINEADRVSS
jgi:integrase